MATLETQYKNYLSDNPNSAFTFEEWKEWLGNNLRKALFEERNRVKEETKKMINNIDLIKPLLNFENEGDFYMLYIFKRKKDQPEGERDNHQSVRTIRSYCIKSIEQLEKRYDEIMMLCEVFRARAYIHIQKQNHKDVALDMMMALAQRIRDGQFEQQNLFDSVVGQLKTYEKRWIVDVDTKDWMSALAIQQRIALCRPEGEKVEAIIPTKNGFHFITSRFDVAEFKKFLPTIDIQKKNPTLLYYPESLDYETE